MRFTSVVSAVALQAALCSGRAVSTPDLSSTLLDASNNPSLNGKRLSETALSIRSSILGEAAAGISMTVQEAFDAIPLNLNVVLDITGLFDALGSLGSSGLLPAPIAEFLNGYNSNKLNSGTNKNPAPKHPIHPSKAPEDAPYSIDEAALRGAIHIPRSFQYGKNGKKPVLLVPGTAIPGGTTYYYNLAKLSSAIPEADIVWVNIPKSSLDDAELNAQYVAYAINYISSVSETNIAVVAWSQGCLNTQWSLKYWPSTRDVVEDFIAISPDFHGTIVANVLCPLASGTACTPSFFQQGWKSDFIQTLRSNGGDSAYVPTTTLFSSFDEIVQPMTGNSASAILGDERGVGVTNNHVQSVCPLQPAGGAYLHEGMLYNPLAWALIADALRHDGPGNVERLDLGKVCLELLPGELGVDDLLGTHGLLLVAVAEILAFNPKASEEPAVAAYAKEA